MRLRRIAAGMDADVVARLDLMLAEIAHAHGVAIPLAVESGSLAWGFPSPDSDDDCRFIFVRPLAQVVSPWPRKLGTARLPTPLAAFVDAEFAAARGLTDAPDADDVAARSVADAVHLAGVTRFDRGRHASFEVGVIGPHGLGRDV